MPVYRGPGTTAMSHLDWFLEYPRPTLLGDGNVFLSGWVANGVRWDPEMPYPASAAFPPPTGTFDYSTGQASTSTVWGLPRHYGSTVFMARYGALQDVVLRLGGEDGGTATETSEICLATQTGAPWISLGDVTGDTTGRIHGNAVVLPDGSVLAVGGNEVGGPAELILARYTPASGWVEANKLPTPRDYHATALLLPDGAVMIGGGDGRFLNVTGTSHDYDVYHPWYMVGQKRPENVVLTNVPTAPDGTYLLVPNQTGVVLQAQMNGIASLDRVVLTAPGSVTHHFDMSARYIELASTSGGPGSRTFQVPAETVAPRGYYLLWAVDNSGVPSKAIWVRIQ